jgi:acyl carrier protein
VTMTSNKRASGHDVATVVRTALTTYSTTGTDPSSLPDEARLGSDLLALTSLDYMRALITIEDELGVIFAERILAEITGPTVGDVARYAADAHGGNGSGGEQR